MKLKIKNIDFEFCIDSGNIYNIIIENPSFLYHILHVFKEKNEDEIFLWDNSPLKIENIIYYVSSFDSLENELNSKKNLNTYYQQVEKNFITDEEKQKLVEISQKINELVNEISLNTSTHMYYNTQLSLKDLFLLANFKFSLPNEDSFISQLIYYIKSINNFNNYKIIVFFNLFDLISQQEIIELQQEISYLNFVIFNITGHNNSKKCTKTIIIDEDLCEIW